MVCCGKDCASSDGAVTTDTLYVITSKKLTNDDLISGFPSMGVGWTLRKATDDTEQPVPRWVYEIRTELQTAVGNSSPLGSGATAYNTIYFIDPPGVEPVSFNPTVQMPIKNAIHVSIGGTLAELLSGAQKVVKDNEATLFAWRM